MDYGHFSGDERRMVYQWRGEGCTLAEIGKRLNRDPGTISREISRNTGQCGYRPKQAHAFAQARAKRPGARTFTAEMHAEVERKIRKGHTPAIIKGRAALEGRAMVCKETIYKSIYVDAKEGGDLWKYLPRSKRKRHRRCPRQDGRGRGRIPGQRRIDTRPKVVDKRERIGDWEGDLMSGASGTGHLATMVDRASRFTLLGHVWSKEAVEVNDCLVAMFGDKAIPLLARLTGTFDNGKEFALHQELARRIGMEIYFAFPYHSWERGTNENTNGLIRRLLPKGSSFAHLDKAALARIESYVNDRPRKCLGWRTPREVFYDRIATARSG
ncbi:MAG: IS30 family transposase [Planctomycetota bacterium]